MNAFVIALCAVTVAVQAATIPEASKTGVGAPKSELGGFGAPSIPSAQSIPYPSSIDKSAERNFRQLYPAGYQVSPYAPPQRAVHSPYPVPAAAPAYPYAAYYPAAYPGYPAQYVPLREGETPPDNSWSSYLPSWSSYFGSPGSYFSNYPSYSSWFGTSEAETPSSASEAEGNSAALLRSGLPKHDIKVQTINSVNSIQPFAPAAPAPIDNRFRYQPVQSAPVAQPQFVVAGSPQFYGAYSAFPAQQDPSKLTAANNGAISSYLFLRNQPQLPVFQQNQQKFAAPATFQTGNVKDSHQQFAQFSQELQGEQSKQVEKESASSENNQIIADASPSAESAPAASQEQQAEEPKKEDENSESASANPPIASAKPKGLAVAGEGGVADSSPRGTALVGKKGMALAAPSSIAIAGPDTPLTITIETQQQSQHKNKKVEKLKPVARFSDARGYHIDYPRGAQ